MQDLLADCAVRWVFDTSAVHNHETIDCAIVFALAGQALSDFEQFAAQVANRL